MDSSYHQLDDAKARALHLLTCPLCAKQYEDPRVLPCHHTFCCRCLLAYVHRLLSSRAPTSSTRLGAFSCPQCLADVGLPAAGASAFPVDQRISNIRNLVVEEMAKDLASRFKGRLQGDGVCNGGGGGAGVAGDDVHRRRGGMTSTTRLSNISERPGVDDGDSADGDSGTWPSSSRARNFGDNSDYRTDFSRHRTTATDDPVFSRQRPGFSSIRGGRTRRSRTDTPVKNNDDARFEAPVFSTSAQTTDETSSDTDGGFSRNRPGYSSMRVRSTRRARMADGETQSIYDDISRSEFGNGRASPQTAESIRNNSQRPASHVDVSSQSSPFDNLNRDDDTSEPYTPIIGRHRLAYSSMRERRRRPVFDPSQLYDGPADFMDEELSSSDGSSTFSNHDSRFTHNRHTSVRSQTPDTSKFSESLRRTVSSDLNWTRYTSDHNAHVQTVSENNYEYESDQVRTSDGECAGRSKTDDNKARRQRPDSLDTLSLTVLSTLPASFKSKISECATISTSNHSQSQIQSDHPNDEVGHQTNVSESSTTSCTLDEVPSMSHTQDDVASQLNGRCHVDLDKTDNVDNRKLTEPTSSDSADSKAVNVDAVQCSPDMSTPTSAGRSAEHNDTVDQTDSLVDKPCSSSEEERHSPPRTPNDSCFSRLTKFRLSKNSRHCTSSTSTVESTSKEAETPSPRLDEAEASTVPAAKPRCRKRPQVFKGTAFSFTASGSEEDTVTSPPSVVRNDELSSESVNSNKEHPSDQQFELHPSSVSDHKVDDVCNDGVSVDADVEGELASTISSQTAADVEDSQSRSSDVSPTAETSSASELPPDIESNDAQTPGDDVSFSEPPAQQRHDEDSAVYSAGVDSDASARSATEPCIPTPTTDDDNDLDDVLVTCAVDELESDTHGDQQDEQKDDMRSHLDNNDCGLTLSESHPTDGVLTDFNVEHHEHDPESISEVHENGTAENGETQGDGSVGISASSSCSVPDELHYQNEQQPQTNDDVNEDEGTSNNKTENGGEGESGSGFRTSQNGIQTDDATDDQSADGYVMATGLAALSDGSLVVADYGAQCVCLCDGEGRADHRVTGVKPFSVATSTSMIASDDDELIYVGDRRRKTLVVLDSHGSDVAQWPDNQFDWICGIACLSDGQLAVLDRSRTRQLGIYATSGDDGRPLRDLGGHGSSLGDLCMAEFIAADSRGRVLVADSGNHCVKAFDHRVAAPSVVAVYGTTRGSGDAQLEWPKGVAVDSADNVLVADCRNGRVVSFCVDGRSLGSVVPAVRGPFAICTLPTSLSHRRRIVVTTYSINGLSQFQMYDYNTDAVFV